MKKMPLRSTIPFIAFAAVPLQTQAQADQHIVVLEIQPGQTMNPEGIDYHSLWNSLPEDQKVQYGAPLLIQVIRNNEKIYLDVSTSRFDDIVVRVPLDELLAQPNRIGPVEE